MTNEPNEKIENAATELAEDFKSAINKIHEGIIQKDIADNLEWILELTEKHTIDRISKLRSFDVYVNSKFRTKGTAMFEYLYKTEAIPNAINPKDKDKIKFIFLQYNFIKHQLGAFIRETCGFSCSQDKVGFLLSGYIANLMGKEIEWDTSKYWVPNAGSKEQWFDLIESIHDLYYARDYGESRLEAMKVISAEFAELK